MSLYVFWLNKCIIQVLRRMNRPTQSLKESLQICVSVSQWKAIKTAELTAGFGQAIWNIRTKKITYAGLPQTTGAHQAASMAFNELLDLPLDISHVCHVSLCVNPDHLSHKDRIVNLQRDQCMARRLCKGHRYRGEDFKPCIFIEE